MPLQHFMRIQPTVRKGWQKISLDRAVNRFCFPTNRITIFEFNNQFLVLSHLLRDNLPAREIIKLTIALHLVIWFYYESLVVASIKSGSAMQILPQRWTSLILKTKINHSTTKVISIYLYTYIEIQFYNSPQLVIGLQLLISTQQVSPFTYFEKRFVTYLFWKIYQEATAINIWGHKKLSMNIRHKSLQLYKKRGWILETHLSICALGQIQNWF